MKHILTLLFLLCLSCLTMGQEVLFLDDFSKADTRVKQNVSTLRSDLWQMNTGYGCHAIYLSGIGGVAYPVQYDAGDDEDPDSDLVACMANSATMFRIDSGSVYTNTVVFRVHDYNSFDLFHMGFQRHASGDVYNITPTLESGKPHGAADDMYLQVGDSRRMRTSYSQLNLRSYLGQWLTFETTIDAKLKEAIVVSARITDPSGKLLALANIVVTDPQDMDLILGRSFHVHNHPFNHLTHVERVMEIKEIRVTRK